ncbi:MAG: glycosyltransferase family 2 protein [Pseudomonadota bacterium]
MTDVKSILSQIYVDAVKARMRFFSNWYERRKYYAHEYLPDEVSFLATRGVPLDAIENSIQQSKESALSPAQLLILDGVITERQYFVALADHLQLSFADHNPSGRLYSGPELEGTELGEASRIVLSRDIGPLPHVFIAPPFSQIANIRRLIEKSPELKQRVKVTTPSSNRAALIENSSGSLLRRSIRNLAERFPTLSADVVATPQQQLFVVSVLLITFVFLFHVPFWSLFALHLLFSVFYLGCVLLRLAAAVGMRPSSQPDLNLEYVDDSSLPTYSVLVALYGEANQAEELVKSLNALDWPRHRLEIKLICESDDAETIAALERAVPGPPFEIVRVPAASPRTKPKALNYALPLCTGDLLVLYDAEDRPHKLQLKEAWSAFATSDSSLACVQAPLIIDNPKESWFSKQFTLEYCGLFDGLLPVLARWRALLPLGGTSNHFRTRALRKVGAWDPYNVTEDADLGIRLARMGYSCGTIRLPTYEEAPITFAVWIKQRSRWFKGWLQTWLVHLRNPAQLFRDLGLRNYLIFHFLISGMIFSAISHIFFLVSLSIITYMLLTTDGQNVWLTGLFAIDFINIVLGYMAFGILAWRALPVRKLSHLRTHLIGIPAYWLLISLGAWRALWQLLRDPFTWEKTPHGASKRRRHHSAQ